MKDKSTVGESKSLDEVLQRKSGIKRNHTWIESENSQLTGGNAAPMKNSLKLSRGSKEENLPHSKPVKGAGDTGGDQQDLEMAEVSKSDTEEVGSLDQDMEEQDLQSNTVSGTDEFTQEMSGSLMSKRLRMYKCERCNSQYMGLAMLRQHCKDVHGDQKYYKCHVCGKLFSHPSSRNIHLRLHSGEKPYKCTTCGKQFRVSSHLKDHVRVHTGERPYICDICHKGFKQSSDLKKHRRTHTLDKPYKCPICPSAFTRSHHCRGHINSVHKFFKCVACSALFTSEEAFERHKELHPTVFSDDSDRRSRLSDDVVTPRSSVSSEMLSSRSSDSIQVDAETRENNLKWDVANQLLELHKISQHTTSRKNSNNSGSETESVDNVSSPVKKTSATPQAVPKEPLVSPTVVPRLTYQGASVSNDSSSSSQKEPRGVSLGNALQEGKRMQGNTIMYPPMPQSIPQGMEYLMLPFQNMNYKREEKCVSSREGVGHGVVLPVRLSPSPSKNISACTSEKQKWSREDQPCSVTTTASSVYSMVNNARLYDSHFATRSGSANQRNFMELSLGTVNSQQEKALTEQTVEGNNSVACHRVSVIQFHSSSQVTPHNTKNPEDLIKEEEKTQEAPFKSDISPLCDSTSSKLDKKPVVIQQQHQDLQPKNGMINDYLAGISQGHVPYVPLNAESPISLQSWKREFGGPFGKYSWALKEAKKTFELLKMREQALQLASSQSLESKQFTIFPQANAHQSKSSFDRSQVTSVDMLKFLAREQIKQNDSEGDLKSPVSAEEDSESSEAVESGHTSNNEQPKSDGGQQSLPADSPEQKGSPENTIHHCQVCKKTFSRSSLLKQHSVIHMGNKRFKFRCEVCGKMFRTRSHLRDHTRIHTGERPFKCHICQKAFKQSSDLKKHINLHTGTNQFKCEECNMEFRRADALRKHKLGHRTGNMPCGHCGKNFLHISALRQHRAMHNVQPVKTNRAFHRCNFCFKTFTKAESFKVHLEEHTQEQSSAVMLFDCKICSMKFFTQDEFTDHMNIHNGKRPYKCFVCEKEFCIAEHLQDHVRLHAEASSRLRRGEGDDEYQRQAELISHSAIHA